MGRIELPPTPLRCPRHGPSSVIRAIPARRTLARRPDGIFTSTPVPARAHTLFIRHVEDQASSCMPIPGFSTTCYAPGLFECVLPLRTAPAVGTQARMLWADQGFTTRRLVYSLSHTHIYIGGRVYNMQRTLLEIAITTLAVASKGSALFGSC